MSAVSITLEDFEKLTRIPIIIYYGDYIPAKPSDNWAMDSWRKTVIPFCTYASTYRDETLARIVELTPDAEHLGT